ncbi:MAG: hypothetical protein GX638_01700 [Crenarchaeota archaeon]|nr:hypothetical protein [Thermoproteota archaeon]
MTAEIKILKKAAFKDITLVVGLPGTAYIGKLSVDYLVQQLKAEPIAEVYSKHFPPYVIIKEDGTVELLRNELHRFKGKDGHEIVFLTGNSQALSPEGQYDLANIILDWAQKHGIKRVISVAALVTEKPFDTPLVYFTATSPSVFEEMKKLDLKSLDQGIIGGENGLIIGLAKKRDIEGICLLAETHGYQTSQGEYVTDAKAAKAALNVLNRMLSLKVNMEPMDKQAEQMDELLVKMGEIERRVRQEMEQSTKKPSYVT